MENEANTPSGTGYTTDEATLAISAILDSEDTTPVEAVVESDENDGLTDEIEHAELEDEQPETDSETSETGEIEEGETETDEATETPTLSDEYEVEMGDGEKVAFGELKKGYLRQQDYTRKTQEVARTKAELDATIYGFNDRALAELETVKKNLAIEFKYNQPDWATLQQEDPYTFAEKRMEWDKREELLKQLHAFEYQTRENQIAYEKQKFENDQVAAREYLKERYPEFKSKETATPIMKEMVGLLKKTGFTKDEIEGVADGRLLEMIYLATKGIAAEAKATSAKKVLAETPKVTPVRTNTNKPRNHYSDLRKQFDADRSNSDAATALISRLLQDQ